MLITSPNLVFILKIENKYDIFNTKQAAIIWTFFK